MLYTPEMLNEKIQSESIWDKDWFCIDNRGHVAIVATGGGMWPNTVVQQLSSDNVIQHFRSLPAIATKVLIQRDAMEEANKMNVEQKKIFFNEPNLWVPKGLFYFDKKIVARYYEFEYYLKARPDIMLTIDNIDSTIRDIVSKTVIDIDFERDDIFHVNEVD